MACGRALKPWTFTGSRCKCLRPRTCSFISVFTVAAAAGADPAGVEDAAMILAQGHLLDWALLVDEAEKRRLALPLWASLDFLRRQGLSVPLDELARLRAHISGLREVVDFLVRSAFGGHHPLRRALLPWLDFRRLNDGTSFWSYLKARWKKA